MWLLLSLLLPYDRCVVVVFMLFIIFFYIVWFFFSSFRSICVTIAPYSDFIYVQFHWKHFCIGSRGKTLYFYSYEFWLCAYRMGGKHIFRNIWFDLFCMVTDWSSGCVCRIGREKEIFFLFLLANFSLSNIVSLFFG